VLLRSSSRPPSLNIVISYSTVRITLTRRTANIGHARSIGAAAPRQRRASRRTCAAHRTKRQTKPIEVQLSTGWLVPTPKGSAARFHAQRNEQLSSVAEKWLRARG
jgi:hypothetical protein